MLTRDPLERQTFRNNSSAFRDRCPLVCKASHVGKVDEQIFSTFHEWDQVLEERIAKPILEDPFPLYAMQQNK